MENLASTYAEDIRKINVEAISEEEKQKRMRSITDVFYEKIKKQKTESEDRPFIVLLIDRSGSTSCMMTEIVGGLNTFVDDQKKNGRADVTVLSFDDRVEDVYAGPLEDVPVFTTGDFEPRGMTALHDAVGIAIERADAKVPSGQISGGTAPFLVIFTDGAENASKTYTSDKIQKIVKEREAWGWNILFIGAGQEAALAGQALGIRADRRSHCDSTGDSCSQALRQASYTRSQTIS